MKKILSIFILLQILTNNSFAEEFVKLPALFTHFYHHTYENHDTHGFVDFLQAHYSKNTEQEQHQDEDKHCNLPFKDCHNSCVNSHVPLGVFMPELNATNFCSFNMLSPEYTLEMEKINSIQLSSIWQPPKNS